MKTTKYLHVIFAMIFVVILGCKKKSTSVHDISQIHRIQNIQNKLDKPIDPMVQKRIDKAILECGNKKQDTVPILFFAEVRRPKDREQIYLYLAFYDEDANLLGIGIREKSNNPDKCMEERYPIYIEHSQPAAWQAILPVSERRNKDQCKDETVWSLYMRSEGGFSISEEKIPIIWISLSDYKDDMPEVFLYDKDGNVSEFLQIENKLDYWE